MNKTKLLLLLSCLFIVMGKPGLAQDQNNGIYVSYAPGFVSAQAFYDGTNDFFNDLGHTLFTTDDSDTKTGMTGIISAGYNRFLSEKIKLGISGSYSKYTNSLDIIKDGEVKGNFKWSDSFITLMLRFDFHYVRKEKISMYSGLSFGVSFVDGKNISGGEDLALPSGTLFAFHLNAFGVRFGKDLGFFLESGFGYNGIISGGISYQF